MVGALAGAALVVPLVLLADAPRGAMDAIRMGGPGMWLIVLFVAVAAVVVTVLGVLLARGRTLPVAAVMGAAVAPLLPTVLVERVMHGHLAQSLGSDATERGTRLRIAFGAMAEETNAPLYGALASGMLLLAAAVASRGALGTADDGQRKRRPWRLSLLSFAISLVWWVMTTSWVVSAKAVSGGLSIFELGLFAQALVIGLAAMCARVVSGPSASQEPAETRRKTGALACAALCSSLALVLVDRAVLAFVERHVWAAASDASMDDGQRARILHEWVVGSRTFANVTVAHGLGALSSFGPALARVLRHGASRSAAAAGAIFVSTVAVFLGVTGARAELLQEHGLAAPGDAVSRAELPVVRDGAMLPRASRSPRVLEREGETPRTPASDVYAVAAAPTMPVGAVVAAVDVPASAEQETRLEIAVRSELPAPAAPVDPELSMFVYSGPPVVVVPLMLPVMHRAQLLPEVRVSRDGLLVTRAQANQRSVPRGRAYAEELRAAVGVRPVTPDLYVVLAKETTVQELVDVVTAFDRGWERLHVRLE